MSTSLTTIVARRAAAALQLALAVAWRCVYADEEGGAGIELRPERALGAGHGANTSGTPTYVKADRISGDVGENVVLEGNAEVRRGGVVLRGDRVVYTVAFDHLQAAGHAHLYEGGLVLSGPALEMKVEPRTGTMPDAEYSFMPRSAHGTAKLVEFLGPDRVRLNDAIFTTCGPGDNSWWIKANRLDLDQLEEDAAGYGVTLYFEGVPVLASPLFEFPLGDHRRSGFLTPGFADSSLIGIEADFPYYWDIAPNRDMTLTTRVIPQRGLLLGDEFRFLEPRYKGILTYDAIEQDRVFGGERQFLSLKTDFAGTSGLSGDVNFNRVSDDQFFIDFSRSAIDSSTEVLPQEAHLTYAQQYWNTTLQVAKYQTLFSLLPAVDAPYDKAPELTFNSQRVDWNGFDLLGTVDVTEFQHPVLEHGTRLVVNPSLAYPIQAPAYFVIPKLQWSYSAYALEPALHPDGDWGSRSLPIASLDSGLVFERDTRWFGSSMLQTLEPRLFYSWIPFRDQSGLPNFDSGVPDLNFAQLFTENVYSGSDRIGEANDLTAALTTRFLDPVTGAEKLRAAIGERFYFSPQPVTVPGYPGRTSKASDLLLSVDGKYDKHWVFDSVVDYSVQNGTFVRANAGVRWQPQRASVISLSYNYDSSLVDPTTAINEYDLGVQWPIAKRLYAVADLNYSIGDKQFVQQLVGTEYRADCWVARFVAQRYVNADLTTTKTYFLQIELNGLTSIGQNPLDQLKRSIPGYQSITPPERLIGPYEDYE